MEEGFGTSLCGGGAGGLSLGFVECLGGGGGWSFGCELWGGGGGGGPPPRSAAIGGGLCLMNQITRVMTQLRARTGGARMEGQVCCIVNPSRVCMFTVWYGRTKLNAKATTRKGESMDQHSTGKQTKRVAT